MTTNRSYLYTDEAGNLAFNSKTGTSRYFMLGSVLLDEECRASVDLLRLKRDLLWEGIEIEQFHAQQDRRGVRDRVFDVIAECDLKAHVTILEKAKSQPHLRVTMDRFYKYATFFHLKWILKHRLPLHDDIGIVTAAVQTDRKKKTTRGALDDVVEQLDAIRSGRAVVQFPQSMVDPGLQIADYILWAVQRKWERGDNSYYDRIKHLIASEFDLFGTGTTYYYGPEKNDAIAA